MRCFAAVLLILFHLGISAVFHPARAQKLDWAIGMGSAGFDVFSRLLADSAGNILATGNFEGTADFDPGPGTANLTSGFSVSYKINPVIARYSPGGSFIWAKGLLGTSTCYANKVAVDADGNIYLTGTFNKGNIDFDPGPAQNLLNSVSTGTAPEMYVCKLNREGDFVWVKRIGNAFSRVVPMDMVLLPSGTLLIGGVFNTFGPLANRTVNFNPAGTPAASYDPEGNDGFLLKLDTAGNYLNSLAISSSDSNSYDDVIALHADLQGNFYATGKTIAAFGADSNRTAYTYLAKFNSSLSIDWVKKFSVNIQVKSMEQDRNNNLCVAGIFKDSVDFDPGPGRSARTASGNTYDIFMASLSAAGNLGWVRQLPGNTDENLDRLKVDKDNRVYVCGSFNGSIDLHPDDAIFHFNTSAGGTDAFVIRLDSNGMYDKFRLLLGSSGNDAINDLLPIAGGDIACSGSFSGSLDMDPDPVAQTNLTPVALSDMFLARYSACSVADPPQNTTPVLNQSVCAGNSTILTVSVPPGQSVSWYETATLGQVLASGTSFNTPVISANKTYFAEAQNSCGSSYQRLAIPVLSKANPDTTVTKTGTSLSVAETGAVYQWIDCSSLLPVPNANGRNFNPATSGSYAVQVTKNACTLRSSCVVVSVPNSVNEFFREELLLYPVPARKELSISLAAQTETRNTTIEIYNTLGQVYLTQPVDKDVLLPYTINISALPAGLWFLVFRQVEQHWLKSFVKE